MLQVIKENNWSPEQDIRWVTQDLMEVYNHQLVHALMNKPEKITNSSCKNKWAPVLKEGYLNIQQAKLPLKYGKWPCFISALTSAVSTKSLTTQSLKLYQKSTTNITTYTMHKTRCVFFFQGKGNGGLEQMFRLKNWRVYLK